jgi:hypothetical protein
METNVEVLRKYRDLFPLVEIKNGQGKEKSERRQLLNDARSDSFYLWLCTRRELPCQKGMSPCVEKT